MKEIGAIMKKTLVLATIYLIFALNAFAQPYIRVYRTSGGQLYGELETYNQDTTNTCSEITNPLTGNDTLTTENCRYQFYNPSASGYIIDLATGIQGQIFTIYNFGTSSPERYILIYFEALGSEKDRVYGGCVKSFIYNGTAWQNYDNGSANNSGLQSTVYGTSAIGYNKSTVYGVDAQGQVQGASFGNGSSGSSYGSALGYQASGSTYGAAMGYTASAGSYGTAIGGSSNGQNNGVAVGYRAKGSNSSVALGYYAGFGANRGNNLFVENSSDTLTPLIYGEFDNDYVKIHDSLLLY